MCFNFITEIRKVVNPFFHALKRPNLQNLASQLTVVT